MCHSTHAAYLCLCAAACLCPLCPSAHHVDTLLVRALHEGLHVARLPLPALSLCAHHTRGRAWGLWGPACCNGSLHHVHMEKKITIHAACPDHNSFIQRDPKHAATFFTHSHSMDYLRVTPLRTYLTRTYLTLHRHLPHTCLRASPTQGAVLLTSARVKSMRAKWSSSSKLSMETTLFVIHAPFLHSSYLTPSWCVSAEIPLRAVAPFRSSQSIRATGLDEHASRT